MTGNNAHGEGCSVARSHACPLRGLHAPETEGFTPARAATNLRVNVESIPHDVRPIGIDPLDLQGVRAVGEPVRPEDGHLVALDRVALVELPPRLQYAVDENVGHPAGAPLLAADPARRRPREAEGRGRTRLVGRGGRTFAPDPRGVVGRPGSARIDHRGLAFLRWPSA